MVVGFNHNFRYRGEVYHVQTEDSGRKNPHIITLLYRGGTILASKKTSYADILGSDHLEKVVEDLMKEQHKEMLRRLKGGELDALIDSGLPAVESAAPAAAPPSPVPVESAAAAPSAAATDSRPAPPVAAASRLPDPAAAAVPSVPTPSVSPAKEPPAEKRPAMSLDDVILSYLVGDDQ